MSPDNSPATRRDNTQHVSERVFIDDDYRVARECYPELYWEVTEGYPSFPDIAEAHRIRTDPALSPSDEIRAASQLLEHLAKRRLCDQSSDMFECVYWCPTIYAGCAMTRNALLYEASSTKVAELALCQKSIMQLYRDARRTLATRKLRQLRDVVEDLYDALTNVLEAADIIESADIPTEQREEVQRVALAHWEMTRDRVTGLIQRQARLVYFLGVAIGGVLSISLLTLFGVVVSVDLGNHVAAPLSLLAATIAGAMGACVSVYQRMASNDLKLDFMAPFLQKVLLGALRPWVGAVFGAVVYFGFASGLLVPQGGIGGDKPATFAFFAMAGFAAGFSERFATDVLERAAGSSLTPAPPQSEMSGFGYGDTQDGQRSGSRMPGAPKPHAATTVVKGAVIDPGESGAQR